MPFIDLFSKKAPSYARYRPHYPPALYSYLAELAPDRELAWDVGTGSGQAALGLAEHFHRVIATDASSEQIAQAQQHERIHYLVSTAEQSGLASASIDLVAIALALHWFDFDRFYAEVRRVLKPGGVLAAWGYHLSQVTPEIDRLLAHFFLDVVGPFWSPRIQYINEHYRTIPFPFQELPPPVLALETVWDLGDLLGFLESWSATEKFKAQRGYSPLEDIRPDLSAAWGPASRKRPVHWPLFFKIGRV